MGEKYKKKIKKIL